MLMDIGSVILIIAAAVLIGILAQILLVKRKSAVKLKLKDEQTTKDEMDDEKLYRFKVSNESDQSVVLTDVRLYSNGTEIFDNGHHPSFKAPEEVDGDIVRIDSKRIRDISHLISMNFLGTTVVQPKEEMTYSYYLDEMPDEIKITVRENKDVDIILKPVFK
ncbi:hypothetical protein [Salinicoccus kekensis]|uniref:DUF4352 domain-containing protein n=1 Tax=Salinicoccus kekensis TaxID=714307 RepID=A0A285UBS9_9STAP|nr:hypothetical protein [Salinicoccus kekensis]SOC39375.1 hypothetical protein SAMN05878391_0854 [Salinicoccus kekensis]